MTIEKGKVTLDSTMEAVVMIAAAIGIGYLIHDAVSGARTGS